MIIFFMAVYSTHFINGTLKEKLKEMQNKSVTQDFNGLFSFD
ncbi:hypothetical protein THIOSC15_3290009 [uncultured Thiomicrorhabdus sp.]